MQKRCERCKQLTSAEQSFYIRGAEIFVCRNCSRKSFSYCPECGNFYCHEDMLVTDNPQRKVCFWCAAEKYYICPRCRTLTSNENKVKYHGYSICRSCSEKRFYCCEKCGGTFEAGMMTEDLKHCKKCEKNLRVKCNICGEILYKCNAKISNNSTCCSKCYERYSRKCQMCSKVFAGDQLYIYKRDGSGKIVCWDCLYESEKENFANGGEIPYTDYLENCSSCNKPLVAGSCFMMDNIPYCRECRNRELQKCEVCGKYTFREFIRRAGADGTPICPTCNQKYTEHRNSSKESAKVNRCDTDDNEYSGSSVFNETLSARLIGGAAVLGMMGVFDKPDPGNFISDSGRGSFCEDADCFDDFCDCDTDKH